MKFLIMDVDGTLTDGKIYVGQNGEVCKAFNVKDGYGIKNIAIPSSIIPVILTGRESKIVSMRCSELGIVHIYQGVEDKLSKLLELTTDLSQVAYIGDDLNDLPCMVAIKHAGGIVGCPLDAASEVKNLSDFVSSYKGGDGAVRDYIEWLKQL